MAGGIRSEAAASEAGAIARTAGGAGGGPARSASCALAGTEAGLLDFFSDLPARPVVWHGVTVRPTGRHGELEVVRAGEPSAVVAWTEGAPPPPQIPERLRPAGGRLVAVRLAGPAPCPAIAGDRFQGEVIG